MEAKPLGIQEISMGDAKWRLPKRGREQGTTGESGRAPHHVALDSGLWVPRQSTARLCTS
jgi:hypothetical protein